MATIFKLKEKQEYEAWLKEKAAIRRLSPEAQESDAKRKKRINDLLAAGHETKFFKYYFSHLASSEFAYFHKRDAKKVAYVTDIFALFEWPREHAKSIVWDVMVPLLLKAKKELTGMMVASSSFDKASQLLSDIQSELMFNQRYIADFGQQYNQGKWTDGSFTTVDGIGFWAFGRGQSPRGTRNLDKRPNYGVIDDIDDKTLVKNEERVDATVEWILEDFYGAMPISASRLIIVGNRIHKKSVIAKIAGDIEEGDSIREGLYHSKVFALENPRTHKKDLSAKGVPAWPRFTRKQLMTKFQRMGWISALKEYFHEYTVAGKIFKKDDFPWVDCLPFAAYDEIITYNDPSYKKSQTSDCKAIVLVGRKDRYFDIIDCYVRQCTTAEMVQAHYTIAAQIPQNVPCKHYMEANFIQDLMLEEYWRYGEKNPPFLRIRGDKRKKPEKEVRIENLTPFTQNCQIRFNKALKGKEDFKELSSQFFAFPSSSFHDDGPDAVEGAVWMLDKKKHKRNGGKKTVRTGQFRRNSKRMFN